MLEFSLEYKKKCFETLKNSQGIEKIIEYLEKNDELSFRFQLEIILDRILESLEYREILNDSQDIFVWNSIVRHYLDIKALYSEFMESYTTNLDLVQKELLDDKK